MRPRTVHVRAAAVAVAVCFALLLHRSAVPAGWDDPAGSLRKALGPHDSAAVLCLDDGRLVFSQNEKLPLVPASILKIVTSLAAFDILGSDFRFKTDFYLRPDGGLVIKGYGDPCLVSEDIEKAAARLAAFLDGVEQIIVDDSFFASQVRIPGRAGDSIEPYDAPNGALCANYNTVNVVRVNGRYETAEPQTPLLPFALHRIEKLAPIEGRLAFVKDSREGALYAGHLFRWFLEKSGCRVHGAVVHGAADTGRDRLVLSYVSGDTLSDVVRKLLLYSNNFIANQLLLACGAKVYGPPADLEKGVMALREYIKRSLGTRGVEVFEGSGLSRQNRISAEMMIKALVLFEPHRGLMRSSADEYYKTGTLSDVNTRAGYIVRDDGSTYAYVIMRNGSGRRADDLLPMVRGVVHNDLSPVGR